MCYCSITVIYCSFSSSTISDERDVTNDDKDTSRHVETKDHSNTSQVDKKK